MEELLQIKEHLRDGNILEAMAIVEELEDMSRSGFIRMMRNHLAIMLTHLIKIQIQPNCQTPSWHHSIRDALDQFLQINNRTTTRFPILKHDQMFSLLEEAMPAAKRHAADEIDGGITLKVLNANLSEHLILEQAFAIINTGIYTPEIED